MRVAFFGHADTPWYYKTKLKTLLRTLISEDNAETFYVGNQGNFDRMATQSLKELKVEFPIIKYTVVLAYLPNNTDKVSDFSNTVFPEEVAKTPPRYAITKRNDWMISNCDTVIAYVSRPTGGAAKFTGKAIKKEKRVINLATYNEKTDT